MKKHPVMILAATLSAGALALSACGGSAQAENSETWRDATSAEAGGGMDKLIEAAQAEGAFNSMGLYDDWANYGGLLKAFSEKYDIEINNDTSTGSSQDLINAVVNRKGQDDSLDYLDTGMTFAQDADADGLLATYQPETIGDIDEKYVGENGTWINHLGGTMAIGCDADRVDTCPTSFADLLKDEYKGKVAIPSNPTTGETGFMIVHAAAQANGGSLDDIKPGVEFFSELKDKGNYLPVEASAGTIETGETPIVINWDYLLKPIADDLKEANGNELKIIEPSDGTVSSFYAASINADAPHPATARLFYEFLFSDEGQNLLLEGYVTPVRISSMLENGTANQEAVDALPGENPEITAPMPNLDQRTANQKVVEAEWPKAMQ
ncbi:ABC transporter substrate-binding protein [Brevibacterium gallinarum]|uniref:ABC transporter substrate-binding protein n=1 Tax=Brevibacterium gallinarum TaxID=2762220 RepID=UPI00296B40E2|nr:extracellular solute-binding protein [Brevibacterium gallinarum]